MYHPYYDRRQEEEHIPNYSSRPVPEQTPITSMHTGPTGYTGPTRPIQYSSHSQHICQVIADYLGLCIGIGETKADGNCFFHSIRMLFNLCPAVREVLGDNPLSVQMMRKWVANKFIPENYETFREVLDLWKSMYEDAYFGQNFFDKIYYEFIEPVIHFLPPTQGMQTRLKETKEALSKLDKTQIQTQSQIQAQAETLLKKINQLEQYMEAEERGVNIPQAMHIMQQVVQTSSFWGEEISIDTVVNELAKLIQRPVGLFILSIRGNRTEQNVDINPIISKYPKVSGNESRALFAYVYYNGGHYQPLKIDQRLWHSYSELPAAVFSQWKSGILTERRAEEA